MKNMSNLNKLLFDACRGKVSLKEVIPSINTGLIDINQGANDNNESTPLMIAVVEKNIEVIQFLASHKNIEINKQDKYGRTAMVHACSSGTREMVKYLLTSKDISPKPDFYYDNDYIAFKYAISFKNRDVLEYLIVDYNLTVSEEIKNFLNKYKREPELTQEILQLINTRDLSNSLTENLINKNLTGKTRKI